MASDWTFDKLVFTGHALRQMFARQIATDEVRLTASQGETVADYPEDTPYPSRLLLAFVDTRPIHVVLGYDELSRIGYVVTAYQPNPDLWEPDFKTRSTL